jgi:hypothetical protein
MATYDLSHMHKEECFQRVYIAKELLHNLNENGRTTEPYAWHSLLCHGAQYIEYHSTRVFIEKSFLKFQGAWWPGALVSSVCRSLGGYKTL